MCCDRPQRKSLSAFTCSGFNSFSLSIFTRPHTSCSFLGLEAEVLKYWDKLFWWFSEAGRNQGWQEGQEIRKPVLSGVCLSRRQGLALGTLGHVSTPSIRLGSARSVKELILASASLFNGMPITVLLTSFSIYKWKDMSLMGDMLIFVFWL